MSSQLILELFERVKKLETKVSNLENQLELNETNTLEKVTRTMSRDYVINKLKKENPNFLIKNGNRASNADILFSDKDNSILLKAKFYHSKSHNPNQPSGWNTVKKSDLDNDQLNLFIFNIAYNEDFYTFFFTKTELLNYVKNKELDKNNLYHFYINIENNIATDYRDGNMDITSYLDRWDLPTKML
ncbi:hypothetical protein [Clostridium novyi]|uniref:hypothetical protein n=1 Tax=Clostridium novyi TaxID=1542 RepID=UPI0004D913FE|nr:hypothetical protein [Clostridium novyi]KEI08525.1 hypothetical protein Z958_12655 [Clostridium novyi B str. NCTC 9691]